MNSKMSVFRSAVTALFGSRAKSERLNVRSLEEKLADQESRLRELQDKINHILPSTANGQTKTNDQTRT